LITTSQNTESGYLISRLTTNKIWTHVIANADQFARVVVVDWQCRYGMCSAEDQPANSQYSVKAIACPRMNTCGQKGEKTHRDTIFRAYYLYIILSAKE